MKLEIPFETSADAETVSRFMIDGYFANHQRWDQGLAELVELDDGPMRPGKRGREVRSFMGRQETEFEIVEVTDRRLRLQDDPSMWTLERIYAVEPHASGARVTFTFDMAPNHPAFRLAFPVARRFIARQVRANMQVLADLLDALPART